MEDSTISLRQADATRPEGRIFASYLDQAAEGFFQFLLGRHAEEIIARAFIEPGHDLSYQHVLFAEADGNIVGMLLGYPGEAHHHADPAVLKHAAGDWNLRYRVVSTLFAPMIRILDTLPRSDHYLQAIAVDSRLRGQGIGSRLLDRAEQMARNNGAQRLALDVSANNHDAIRLYQNRGFRIVSSWPERLRIPKLAFHRMCKDLDR